MPGGRIASSTRHSRTLPEARPDIPAAELAQFGIEAKHPDEFVMDLFHLDGARVHQAVSATAAAWRNPPGTPADVCDRLAAAGLPISAAALRR